MQEANTNNDTPVVADMVCVVDINATYWYIISQKTTEACGLIPNHEEEQACSEF